jgi:hypothetical protein
MPVTLPLEVYEALEKGLGKEDAKKVVKSLEDIISDVTEYKWKVTKDELLDAIRKEFVTREFFDERFNLIDERFKGLEREMNERFKGLEREMNERFNVVDERFKSLEKGMNERFNVVDEKFKSLNFKLNIFIVIALIALTFANPTFVKLLEKFF